jgi:hypothetical protein
MKFSSRLVFVVALLLVAANLALLLDRRSNATIVHAANGGPNVTIDGPLPLPVLNSVTQPVQVNGSAQPTGFGTNIVLYTVPAGKRLVVEHFSSEAGVATTTSVGRFSLGIAPNASNPGFVLFSHFLPPSFSAPCGLCSPNQVEVITNHPVRMYVEAGQTLVVNMTTNGAPGPNAFIFVSVTGYLVNA